MLLIFFLRFSPHRARHPHPRRRRRHSKAPRPCSSRLVCISTSISHWRRDDVTVLLQHHHRHRCRLQGTSVHPYVADISHHISYMHSTAATTTTTSTADDPCQSWRRRRTGCSSGRKTGQTAQGLNGHDVMYLLLKATVNCIQSHHTHRSRTSRPS